MDSGKPRRDQVALIPTAAARARSRHPRPHAKLVHMAISKELLEILVCPLCKAALELKPTGTGLKCVECKRVYPIRDDIPVMLIDEARIED
jgi:hypothetical protein